MLGWFSVSLLNLFEHNQRTRKPLGKKKRKQTKINGRQLKRPNGGIANSHRISPEETIKPKEKHQSKKNKATMIFWIPMTFSMMVCLYWKADLVREFITSSWLGRFYLFRTVSISTSDKKPKLYQITIRDDGLQRSIQIITLYVEKR